MLWKTIIILFIALSAYILLGAVIFHYLEHSNEARLKEDTKLNHMSFLSNFSCLSQDDLEDFVKTVLDAHKKGVVATANFTSATNWDFYSSLFFTITVVTTIGYGNIAPTTLGGQIFCIFYAMGGIPICTVLLASIGQKLRYPITKLQERVVVGRTQAVKKCVKVVFIVFIGDVLMILVPSIMFSVVEGWHYGVSVYYSFITLTTIGFGDYVAGLSPAPHRELYRVLCGIWVLFGLAWVALVIGEVTGDLTNKIIVKETKCKHVTEKKYKNASEKSSDLCQDQGEVEMNTCGQKDKL